MTDSIPSLVKGFGSPYEDFDENFFSQILREYAVSLLTMTIERYPHVLTCDPSVALSLLTYPLGTNALPFWCPELAHNFTALKSSSDPAKAARGIGQILLNLSSSGVPGDWGIRMDQPSRLHWRHYLLPPAETIEVQSDGRNVSVRLDGAGKSLALSFQTGEAATQSSNYDVEVIPHISDRDVSLLFLTDALVKEFDLPQPDFPVLNEIGLPQFQNVTACLDLLREHFPACSVWVERVLRYLCLVHSPPHAMHSGSFEGFFGMVFMTDRHHPVKSAEMLIHECSHQYFAILTRYTELTDDDGRLYYSPFVKKERPADRILLAYHAFANVEIFYKKCIRAGISVSYSQSAIEQLRPDLDFVEQALVSDINFTAFGRPVMDSLLTNRAKI